MSEKIITQLETENVALRQRCGNLESRLTVLEKRILGALETRNKMTIVFPEAASPETIKRICEAMKDAAEQVASLPNPLTK